MRATDASIQMNEVEMEGLRKQAIDQAEQFEVLNKKDVASLSRVCPSPCKDLTMMLTLHRNYAHWTKGANISARPTSLCGLVAKSYMAG
jgi:hypothetical protein